MTELPDDLQELLACLHDAGAELLVIGGVAVAFYGQPRATEDLDVLVRATRTNAHRLVQVSPRSAPRARRSRAASGASSATTAFSRLASPPSVRTS